MPQPQAVLFDVDGTLIDTVDLHAEAWARTFREFGLPGEAGEIRLHIGKGGDQLLPGLVPPDVLEAQREAMTEWRADLFRREFMPRVRAFPGVRDLFERLRAEGIRVALATSGTPEEIEHHVKLLDVGDLLDAVATSDDAERSKPFPDIFAAAFARLGLADPARVVVVGDTPYDAEAARGGGFPSIGVLCGGFPEGALRAAGCSAIFRDPADLLARFEDGPLRHGFD